MLNEFVESRTWVSELIIKNRMSPLEKFQCSGAFQTSNHCLHRSVQQNWVSRVENALEGILNASQDVLLLSAVYCCCCLANVSLPGLGGTVPESKPFFYVNVADIEMLETEVSYVACKYDGSGMMFLTLGCKMS